jgi:hypothetical protein
VAGPTGAGKSELVALMQRAYGRSLDARHLPESWASTANRLERVAHALKDSLFVVDDWLPADERAQREADRLLRAQGNRSGRGRLPRDATFASSIGRGV